MTAARRLHSWPLCGALQKLVVQESKATSIELSSVDERSGQRWKCPSSWTWRTRHLWQAPSTRNAAPTRIFERLTFPGHRLGRTKFSLRLGFVRLPAFLWGECSLTYRGGYPSAKVIFYKQIPDPPRWAKPRRIRSSSVMHSSSAVSFSRQEFVILFTWLFLSRRSKGLFWYIFY